jgi:hypothetical protein
MAQHQCPNCGGFKTYSWKSEWLFGVMEKGIYIGILGGVLLFISSEVATLVIGLAVAVVAIVKFVELVTRPAKSHVCEICDCNFTPSLGRPVQVNSRLIEMGNALLERQRAAEAEAEEERYQQEQRRRYAGT